MWRFIKQNRRMIVLTLLALTAGLVIGLCIGLSITKADGESKVAGNVGVQSILPTTKIEKQVYFTKCPHQMKVSIDANAFIGYTESELAAFYQAYHISKFNAAQTVLIQTVEGYCPDHFVLRMDADGTVYLYHTDPEQLKEMLVQAVNFDARSDINDEERTLLKNGLAFDTLKDIDAYLEGMES
ncbi:MAG: hypothetical protein RRZ24_03265 [Clostridia bacterium]